jgi:hypothetical protein
VLIKHFLLVIDLQIHEQHISLQGEFSSLFGNNSNLQCRLTKHLSTVKGDKVGCYPISYLIEFLCDSCISPSRPSVFSML